ncbi:MAG: ZIP family metal transporter [Gammaproteobacteria bacterium]|nr:MAG: ZIP family metal transporter [Gammaproteobacteria bacterium]
MDDFHPIVLGTFASSLATIGTALGAAAVFFIRRLEPRVEDMLLSSAAGIMLAATFFSLLMPGLERGSEQFGSESLAALVVIGGLIAGAVLLWLIHLFAPHEHFIKGPEGPRDPRLGRIWLFVIAITLHNFPEGMAVGVGAAAGGFSGSAALTLGIGLQNIPEGLAVAVSLLAVGYSRAHAFWIGLLSGLVMPLGGLLGSAAVWLAEPLLPAILGFAAGAMLFIISDEIIPETHRRGFETAATFSLIVGFAVMMLIEATIG